MVYSVIAFSAFLASAIAFLSGFGFLTLVMPVLAIFLPIPLAIATTALVHLFHTILKLGLTARFIHFSLALRFGIIAIIFAIPGTLLLRYISNLDPFYTYYIGSVAIHMTYLKLAVGVILLFAATVEKKGIKNLKCTNIFVSGALSGFIGGLTGNQGAFRSLFLLQLGLNKKGFIATGAAISFVVDIVRLFFYYHLFPSWKENIPILIPAAIGSAAGIILGMFVLNKIRLHHIRFLVRLLLYIFGIAFLLGIL